MPPKSREPAIRALLLASSALVTALAVAAAIEATERVRYERWRRTYTNVGNLGTITVPSPDPVLIWEYKPYSRRAERPLLATNRWGFRERDLETRAKPAGIFRIAFIGDSITLGLYVAESRTFVRRFEEEAARRAPARRVEALNFGVDGYNAAQVRRLLETKALPFAPDLAVYALCLNDFDYEDASGEKILFFRAPRSFFLRWLDRRWRILTRSEYHHHHFEKRRDAVFAEIRAMRDLLEASRAGFLVAVVPVLPVLPEDAGGFAGYRFADLHAAIGAFLDDAGIARIDLLDAFRASGCQPHEVALDPWHPSAKGHQVIAEALATRILGEPLLASGAPEGAARDEEAGGEGTAGR